uniref:FAM192A/Fyv6 N-terminal domain-containing protein n=1 Tax=Odontella aurita TaxID=265563 RepID=A0A7S4M9X9_9STRA|mmetsp:Transcript_15320/g.44503  ORF Transcript_15320/g.44503 Transcript_15320/m.44503 type:complete len:250 (+) Transcript_15320:48-797(+)
MSLSFVSSAVLSSTDGVSHNEEKPIESSETKSLRFGAVGGSARPLFEQLRSNRQAEEEKRDEAAKALRGTRTLDDEDCAHLDAVERVRMEREARVRDEVEDEVAAFRAARADRQAGGGVGRDLDDDPIAEDGKHFRKEEDYREAANGPPGPPATSSAIATIPPKIIVKKRRRRLVNSCGKMDVKNASDSDLKRLKEYSNEAAKSDGQPLSNSTDGKGIPKPGANNDESNDGDSGGGLGGLLGGYGSDSD